MLAQIERMRRRERARIHAGKVRDPAKFRGVHCLAGISYTRCISGMMIRPIDPSNAPCGTVIVGRPRAAAGVAGFAAGHAAANHVLTTLVGCALDPDCIAPLGARPDNHRHEQSALTLAAWMHVSPDSQFWSINYYGTILVHPGHYTITPRLLHEAHELGT
jgi:hypothetical protein